MIALLSAICFWYGAVALTVFLVLTIGFCAFLIDERLHDRRTLPAKRPDLIVKDIRGRR